MMTDDEPFGPKRSFEVEAGSKLLDFVTKTKYFNSD
jgi:hypothetical protein